MKETTKNLFQTSINPSDFVALLYLEDANEEQIIECVIEL